MLDFRTLGPLEVFDGDRRLALGGLKQRALLAALLLRRNQVVSTDRLIDALWGEQPPSTASTIVRVYVSNLRKTLGGEVLVTRGGGYMLAVESGQVDSARFEVLVTDGRAALAAGDAVRARDLLESAFGLWRGGPLADLSYEPCVQAEIARLEEARVSALEDRIEADLLLGRHREVIGELEGLVAGYPNRERLLGLLMLALYRCGRQVNALEAYRNGQRVLAEELGLEPGPELRSLEARILNHDPGLEAPPRSAPGPRAPARRVRRGRLLLAGSGVLLLVAATSGAIAETRDDKSVLAAANTVAAIDTRSGHLTAVVAVGADPQAVAFGSGSLWVVNVDDQSVSRVDPATLRTVRTLSVGQNPAGIAATATAVWVVTTNPTSPSVSVSRIDPLFDTIRHTTDVGNVVVGSGAAIAASSADLWVAPLAGNVTELATDTGRVVKQSDPNADPTGIAIGTDAVWVSDNQADTVTRIDPSGLTTPIAVGHRPEAIAVGDNGVWVADNGDNAVVRIDPDTQAVTATIPVGTSPTAIAVGDGSVWVADSGDGTVTRIDPTTLEPATIHVGGSPRGIAVADGHAWVTVDQPAIPPAPSLPGATLRIDSAGDVDSMDPALAYSALSWQLLYVTCANLLNYPDTLGAGAEQVVPEVAQSLPARSADGLTYTFTLRPGYQFSPPSNQAVTAETFKYAIERTLNPAMKSPVDNEFADIVGATDYMAGRSDHISGITARDNTLTVRLTAPIPDLAVRLAQPFFCAVPLDTPIDAGGVTVIPAAGPYRVASDSPGQGVVLTLNPNYHGNRPHRFARIELRVNIPPARAVAQVEAGTADYAVDGEITSADIAAIAARYGPGSPAARAGHQQYFVNPLPEVDFLALNTERPLFADLRLRQAVNYAIDRSALARLGGEDGALPENPTDDYLPPGVPGYTNQRIYPLTPDRPEAKNLARGHPPATAVLYTCDQPPCAEQAQIITTDLAAIGLQVRVRAFSFQALYARLATPDEPFDLAWVGWGADYLDPDNFFNFVLESGTIIPPFNDPAYQKRIAAAAKLTGPTRYLTYAKLDADLIRDAAPWVAFANASTHELFSPRIGCETTGRYGLDLAALCTRANIG